MRQTPRSHAERGNARPDALRRAPRPAGTQSVPDLRSHAERGNEEFISLLRIPVGLRPMWKNNLSLRVAAPTVLVSGLLLAFCVAAVAILYSQQATSAAILGENVNSAQVAHDLENTLYDLVSLLRDRNEQVGALHKRIRQQLAQAGQLADKAAE